MSILAQNGAEPCQEGALILKRTFTGAGANRQFINASPTTLAVLKGLGDMLVDLHGPHDHQSLLSDEKQLDLLDAFAGAGKAREAYARSNTGSCKALVAEHAELSASEASLERELDLLRHQVSEIEAAQLQPGEEAAILARYAVASNSRRLIEISTAIVQRLAEAEDAALPRLAEAQRHLRELEKLDPAMAALAQTHAECGDRTGGDRAHAAAVCGEPGYRSGADGATGGARLPFRNAQAEVRRDAGGGDRSSAKRPRRGCARSRPAARNWRGWTGEITTAARDAGRSRREADETAHRSRAEAGGRYPAAASRPRLQEIGVFHRLAASGKSRRFRVGDGRVSFCAEPGRAGQAAEARSPPAEKSPASCWR